MNALKRNKCSTEGQLYSFQRLQVCILNARQNKDAFWLCIQSLEEKPYIWSILSHRQTSLKGSEWNGMKYCTDVHDLLRKQEVSDLKLLWLVIWSSGCRSTDWFTSLMVPCLTFCRRCNSNSLVVRSNLLLLVTEVQSSCSGQFLIPLWSVQMRCIVLSQLILVLRMCKEKWNGLERVLPIYFSSVLWYVCGNCRYWCSADIMKVMGKTAYI